jgi:2-polyprenyl-3-methyl-5-hydroxy-6-metoxy-1,4-benzoquinol methylase
VEQAVCNVCGASAGARLFTATDYLTGERFEVVACARCALAFVNPRPSAPELGRYYPPVYYGPRRSIFDAVTMKLRVRRVERIHGGPPGRVLDVGCGHGGTLRALRARGWQVAGTEFGSRPDTVPGDLDIRYAPLEASGLPAGSFDVVTMWHVLEHMPDPQATLREVRRLLAPGGHFLVAVPNFASLQSRLTGPDWFHLDVPRHLYHFRPDDLATLLARAGFTVQRTRRFSFEYDTFGFVQSVLNRALGRPNLLFDVIAHRGAHTASAPVRTALSVALAAPLLVVALAFCPLESLFGYGGTLEVVATGDPAR